MTKKQYSPWLWIPSLCTAEEIPSAVVMYVALLMFLQFGASETAAAIYSALLFLPWVMKSYFYSKVEHTSFFKRYIHLVESLQFLCLMGIAVYISEAKVRVEWLFAFLFILSLLCAWHELLSRIYYSRTLYPRQQRLFMTTKMLSSQMALVVTYGVLIIVAGFFEVFFRSYQKAWAMESSLVAGGFLLFMALNFIVLCTMHPNVRCTMHPNVHRTSKHRTFVILFFLLLPQALLFNTRVFFLLAPLDMGGLGCSVQDVGFAQGTIGVLAFSLGIVLGRAALKRWGGRRVFAPTAFVLTLSPCSYMLMARSPHPDHMLLLCCTTFFAQFCFGFGLTVCRLFVRAVSGHRYSTTTNFLYVPVVASVMLVPMAVSGWLCIRWGYRLFFTLCTLAAPVAWVVMALCQPRKILFDNESN